MRVKGLEPPRRKTPDPKSGSSTNSAIHAYLLYSKLYLSLRSSQPISMLLVCENVIL